MQKQLTTNFLLASAVFLFVSANMFAQTTDSLRQIIQQILSTKNALVGVAIADANGNNLISFNDTKRCPTQSVYKFHIALTMMSQIDNGKFSLDQKIPITEKDLAVDLYSPIKDKFPKGTQLTIAEIIQYTVSESDGIGCDVLLRLLGGPKTVEKYFITNKFKDISIKTTEEVMQKNWANQFQNWTTPIAANKVLSAFYKNTNNLLSTKSHAFIWNVMKQTVTGEDRLKGQLPKGTIVAHKTGSSGVNKQTGIIGAINDIGVVFLPDGRHFFISVFVTNSKEQAATNAKIIADIAKATWDYFLMKTK
jgi:beta-lactamase class A/beta-lactamase class A VEB